MGKIGLVQSECSTATIIVHLLDRFLIHAVDHMPLVLLRKRVGVE
jgi:hypothetical protein